MQITYPFEAPAFGAAIEIAPNIIWVRIPLPMALNHLNAYIFLDPNGATIVDTGVNDEKTRAIWRDVIQKWIHPMPVTRVLVTHYHPDHIGLAGWLCEEYGAHLWTSRTSFLMARALWLDYLDLPTPLHAEYWRKVGYDTDWIRAKMSKRPYNLRDNVAFIPREVRVIHEDERVDFAGLSWHVRFAQGHAPDQVTLWRDDFVLVGDHCLPGITPVIGAFPNEPDSDPLSEFMETSKQFIPHAHAGQLFLPGHNRPFYGGDARLKALNSYHEKLLTALLSTLETPKRMIDCFDLLFTKPVTEAVEHFAISEAIAHFNYLERRSQIKKHIDSNGIVWWQKSEIV